MIDCLVYDCFKFTLFEGHPSHNLDGNCLDWCLVYAKAIKGDTIHRRMPTWATILNRWCLLFGLLLRKHRTHDSICVCVYMCVYTYTHIHTYTHTHKHIYVAHRHIHTCVGFMVARAIPYMYYVYVCVYMCVYVCICVYGCVYVYSYISCKKRAFWLRVTVPSWCYHLRHSSGCPSRPRGLQGTCDAQWF